MWEDVDRERSEHAYRQAVKYLVEAFLEDREANRNLFVIAHRAGAIIEERFGCTYEAQPGAQTFRLNCPIDKLHSRVGASIAAITESKCSICGAGELDCDHVPGQYYDGDECIRRVTKFVAIDHVALTSNPDFAYTFIGQPDLTLKELTTTLGRAPLPGESIRSRHCRDCYGRHYAKPDDLDTSLWSELVAPEPGADPSI
jgi:hypothetical protein